MSLINPFVFNQFGPYGAYAQVGISRLSLPAERLVSRGRLTVIRCSRGEPLCFARDKNEAHTFVGAAPRYFVSSEVAPRLPRFFIAPRLEDSDVTIFDMREQM